jgi:hypothetical protein
MLIYLAATYISSWRRMLGLTWTLTLLIYSSNSFRQFMGLLGLWVGCICGRDQLLCLLLGRAIWPVVDSSTSDDIGDACSSFGKLDGVLALTGLLWVYLSLSGHRFRRNCSFLVWIWICQSQVSFIIMKILTLVGWLFLFCIFPLENQTSSSLLARPRARLAILIADATRRSALTGGSWIDGSYKIVARVLEAISLLILVNIWIQISQLLFIS